MKITAERPQYTSPTVGLCTKDQSEKFLEILRKIGLFWHITIEPEEVFSCPPKFEIIWIVGRKLKFELGIHRSFYLNTILYGRRGGLSDTGWPHIVVFESCPIFLCVDVLDDTSLLEGYVESARKMYADAQDNYHGS